jgi:hypothetical protein
MICWRIVVSQFVQRTASSMAKLATDHLNPVATPAEEQIKDDNQQNQAKTAPAVVADARTHVVSAAAKQKQKNDEQKYQWHARQCSMSLKTLDGTIFVRRGGSESCPLAWWSYRGRSDVRPCHSFCWLICLLVNYVRTLCLRTDFFCCRRSTQAI